MTFKDINELKDFILFAQQHGISHFSADAMSFTFKEHMIDPGAPSVIDTKEEPLPLPQHTVEKKHGSYQDVAEDDLFYSSTPATK